MELKDSRAFGTAFDSLVLELVLSQFCWWALWLPDTCCGWLERCLAHSSRSGLGRKILRGGKKSFN